MNATLDQQDRSVTDAAAVLRDEDGAIRPEFLEQVGEAIATGKARRRCCSSSPATCTRPTPAT